MEECYSMIEDNEYSIEVIHMEDNFSLESINPEKGRTFVYDLHYHIVWVTKYRNKAFTNAKIVSALKDRLKFIAEKNDFKIEAIEIMPNHVHLLVSAKPKLSITDIVRNLKGNPSRWLFQNYPELRHFFWHNHIWSHTYYVGSVGNTSKDTIKNYINTQRRRPYK